MPRNWRRTLTIAACVPIAWLPIQLAMAASSGGLLIGSGSILADPAIMLLGPSLGYLWYIRSRSIVSAGAVPLFSFQLPLLSTFSTRYDQDVVIAMYTGPIWLHGSVCEAMCWTTPLNDPHVWLAATLLTIILWPRLRARGIVVAFVATYGHGLWRLARLAEWHDDAWTTSTIAHHWIGAAIVTAALLFVAWQWATVVGGTLAVLVPHIPGREPLHAYPTIANDPIIGPWFVAFLFVAGALLAWYVWTIVRQVGAPNAS